LLTEFPQKFGAYVLLGPLGEGGMGAVYLAMSGHREMETLCVVKRLRRALQSEPEHVRRFRHEADLARRLVHSNLAHTHNVGVVDGEVFLVQELVEGHDVSALLDELSARKRALPVPVAVHIASEIARGLSYAHAFENLELVHRDINPPNIRVTYAGEVKLLDFGIAKAENLVSETRVGEIKGKLGYLSPEQVTCKNVDQRSDLFSLGTVLYEWVTGYKLFGGGSDVEVLRNVVEGKIYPPSYFKEDIPQAVENILMRTLNRNREERYQTAWELKYDLDQFLASHEFTPSSIHLSNFIRQIFSDELAEETRKLGGGLEHLLEPGEAGTDLIAAEQVKRAQTGTKSEKPVVLEKERSLGADPDALESELLASGAAGHLSVTLDIEKREAERLLAVAERNHLTLSELIRDLLRQFTKYLD
jgi:serine/threonine protein kinase